MKIWKESSKAGYCYVDWNVLTFTPSRFGDLRRIYWCSVDWHVAPCGMCRSVYCACSLWPCNGSNSRNRKAFARFSVGIIMKQYFYFFFFCYVNDWCVYLVSSLSLFVVQGYLNYTSHRRNRNGGFLWRTVLAFLPSNYLAVYLITNSMQQSRTLEVTFAQLIKDIQIC